MTTTTELSLTTSSKRRRIMIITGDEDVLKQIRLGGMTPEVEPIVVEFNDATQNTSHLTAEMQASVNRKKSNSRTLTCVVCGGTAHGYNFDAITCASCKAFFRRNAYKDPEELKCEGNHDCQINFALPRRCSACRLIKCLNSGMRRDRLLTDQQRADRRQKIEENRRVTLNSPRNQSVPSSPVITNHSPINSTSSMPVTRTLLTVEEQQHIENIQRFYQKRIDIAADNGLPWNPSMAGTSLLQCINCSSVTALRLLSFFKQIPDFVQLNIDDKMTLIKYNLIPIFILNASLCYKLDAEQFIEADSDAPCDAKDIQKYHGIDLSLKLKKIVSALCKIGQFDERIIQLSLVILLYTKGFSTMKSENEPILNDGMTVFRVQSYYTELLWKYLEMNHGSNKALRIFNTLVSHFVAIQNLNRALYNNLQDTLSPLDIEHMLPIMKTLLLFS
ncbi:unnamed protein product [Rotaria sordida]|uniref:Uncharacterized protein n=1 Tax=Rotaria sordida TaxID=392033 RepID=A0A819SJS3_9BILA|nr:unnamed protein product [Rotaria sordida]